MDDAEGRLPGPSGREPRIRRVDAAEVTAFLERIVIPHKPALVVIYGGGNDINAGRSAEQVTADFKALVAVLHDALPLTRIDYISIAPNPARWSQVETVKRANRQIADYVATDSRLAFIDVFPRMLGPDGMPKPDIFRDDQLHMNAAGYAIWTEVIRPYSGAAAPLTTSPRPAAASRARHR